MSACIIPKKKKRIRDFFPLVALFSIFLGSFSIALIFQCYFHSPREHTSLIRSVLNCPNLDTGVIRCHILFTFLTLYGEVASCRGITHSPEQPESPNSSPSLPQNERG